MSTSEEWGNLSYHNRNVRYNESPRHRKSRRFHVLIAASPRVCAGRRIRVPSRRAREGGAEEGAAPFFAHRCRSRHELAKAKLLPAIVNGNLSSFVLPHHHPALGRCQCFICRSNCSRWFL